MSESRNINANYLRTHRERKDRYLKSLEREIVILRDAFSRSTNEKIALQTENIQLRQIIIRNGLSLPTTYSSEPTSAIGFPTMASMDTFPSTSIEQTVAIPSDVMPGLDGVSQAPIAESNIAVATPPMPVAPELTERINVGYAEESSKLTKKYSRVGLEFVLE